MTKTLKKIIDFIISLLLLAINKRKKKKVSLLSLAQAMAEAEGYYLKYYTRAQKNKNPLNLKGSPFTKVYDRGGFCIFTDVELGWKAGIWDLKKKCKGETVTGLNPKSTLSDLIFTWTATDRANYLDYVCHRLSLPKDFQLKNFNLNIPPNYFSILEERRAI